MKPFEELCVLDLSQGVAGPYCTMYLADLGCQVIKVEPPWGDWGRMMGVKVGRRGSVVYSSLNRGKQSWVVDAQSPEGHQMLQSLATQCDILVESFRPGVMERLQLGWEQLQGINPSLIYCSISAFGAKGPYREKKGTDSILQGLSGLMSITGEQGGSPLKVGLALSDMFAGLLATQAILSAVLLRQHDKQGKRIEISLMEALLELQRVQLTEYLLTDEPPKLKGNAHAHLVPSRSFSTADGEIMVAVLSSSDWTNFCEALCLSAEIRDQFADPRNRVLHQAELYAIIEPLFLEATSQQWLDTLDTHDILCGPIYNYETLFDDPQFRALEIIDQESIPNTLKSPVRFVRNSSWPHRGNAPDLGVDTGATVATFTQTTTLSRGNND